MHPKSLHILISPLDWGLGHASRCIPIINLLINAGHKVTLAGNGRSKALLHKEFPHLEGIELNGFSPSYSKSGNMVLHLLMLLPQFIRSVIQEHRELKRLISQNNFDIIISDNRYGLWHKQIMSILITHQVMIKTPKWLRFAEYPLYCISRLMISRFDECWIPDYPDSPGLSGDLSHKYPLPGNAMFIGPLSRFETDDSSSGKFPDDGKIIAIISGPEPQRSIFEDLVTKQLIRLNKPAIVIGGKPESDTDIVTEGRLTIMPHMSTGEISECIISSSLVICRSGYSSIMDLQALGSKALFVPTPGQTEQIYLAWLYQKTGIALWRKQESMNLDVDIEDSRKYRGFKKETNKSGIASAIADLKKK